MVVRTMAEDTIPPELVTYKGYILLKREVDAHNKSEAESLMQKRAADIQNDSILKDMEVSGMMVEEE